jgi:hypothetical protein
MKTTLVRYIGPKKIKHVDLPIGASSMSELTGVVTCDPVGEFPADQARALLAVPGASKLYILESEYQAEQKAKEKKAPSKPADKKSKKGGKEKPAAPAGEEAPPAE